MFQSAQALAAMRGRAHVLPDDIKALASPVLAHRCLLRPESALRGRTANYVIAEIIDSVPLNLGENRP